LEIEDAFDLAAGPDVDAARVLRVGGLSAVVARPSGELLVLSDARTSPRVLMFHLSEKPFLARPTGMISLRNTPEPLDPEGVALLPNGNLLVASEGIQSEEPRTPPRIFEYTADGNWVRTLPIRNRFVPRSSGPLTRGVRPNMSFESLALSGDATRLFTALESALVQDGEPADFERGSRVRIVEYVRQEGSFVPGREWAYDTEPVARPDFAAGFFGQGLVELLTLPDGDLLALERSYVEERDAGSRSANRIRLFRVSLKTATDISGMDSIADRADVRPASKQLVADLQDTPGLPPALSALENFEAMTFVRSSSDGRRRLLMVSDDNFSSEQRTWFLRLSLEPGSLR
jgi:hypothetical protein